MKITYRYAAGLVALSLVLPAAADVIYSNMQDILIPADYDGVYLDVDGPNGWNTNMFNPVVGWDINPFLGGSVLSNSPDFQPVRNGTGNLDRVLNLAVGSSIGSGSVFSSFTWDDDANPLTPGVPGYGGSQDHLAASAGAGKFVIGEEGYFGFRLNNSSYGWMRVVFTNNTGGGMIKDWAYDNSGASIVIGRVEQSAPSNNTQLVTLAPVTGESYTLGSVISNTGGNVNSVLKTGAGTTTLTGTNTYSGVTTVSEGKLLVNGSNTGTGAVSVATGATLGGTGTLSGPVNVTGVLAPGASVATLATGELTMNALSTFAYEVDSSVEPIGSSSADLQIVNGNLNLSLTGVVNLTLDDLSSNPQAFPINTKFSLINYTDTWNSGVFTYNALTLANGTQFTAGLNTWLITYNDAIGGVNFSNEYVGGHFVNLTVVPETGIAILGGIGLLTLLRRRRIA